MAIAGQNLFTDQMASHPGTGLAWSVLSLMSLSLSLKPSRSRGHKLAHPGDCSGLTRRAARWRRRYRTRSFLLLLVERSEKALFVGKIEPSSHRLGNPVELSGLVRALASPQGLGEKLGDDPLKRLPLFLQDLFELQEDSGLKVDEGFGHTW